jgi:hypothetical protein
VQERHRDGGDRGVPQWQMSGIGPYESTVAGGDDAQLVGGHVDADDGVAAALHRPEVQTGSAADIEADPAILIGRP